MEEEVDIGLVENWINDFEEVVGSALEESDEFALKMLMMMFIKSDKLVRATKNKLRFKKRPKHYLYYTSTYRDSRGTKFH